MLPRLRDLKPQRHQFLPHCPRQRLIPLEQRLDPLLSLIAQVLINIVFQNIFQNIALPGRFFRRRQRLIQRPKDHIPDLSLIKLLLVAKIQHRNSIRRSILSSEALILILQRFISFHQLSHALLQLPQIFIKSLIDLIFLSLGLLPLRLRILPYSNLMIQLVT